MEYWGVSNSICLGLEFFAPKAADDGKWDKFSDGGPVDMVRKRRYTEVFSDGGGEAADIGTATHGRSEVGDSEAVAWCTTFFEDIPISPDVGPSEVITKRFAEVGYWWDAVDFLKRVFYDFSPHLGLDFS